MSVDLLAVVQAEAEADKLVQDALASKEQLIAAALARRKELLESIKPPVLQEPRLRPLDPGITRLKAVARKNKQRAVKAVLEALYEA